MSNAIDSLQPLLEPQERLDRLIRSTFRRFGQKAVDLSYANVYDGPDACVREALAQSVSETGQLCFQYSPYGGRTVTRRAVASTLSQESGLPFDFRDVILTPGAMAALNVVLRALFDPEDEVLLLAPCWHDYPLYVRNLGLRMRFVPLLPDKHLDLEAIAEAVGPRTKGVLLSQPCCPTGVLYSPDEIEGLSAVLQESEQRVGTSIYLISDEVHRNLIWSRRRFCTPLSTNPRSVSIYSFGKALALQGQRIGYVAVSPSMPDIGRVRELLERSVRLMGFCGPTDLMQRAVCRLLDYRPALDSLAARHEAVRSELGGCGYEVCDADATFFVYVRSPIPDDVEFADLLASEGVLVAPSSLFHEPGYFRLSLTARAEAIERGLPVFSRVLQRCEAAA